MSEQPVPNEKNNVKIELYSDERNRCLLCKFPDSYAKTHSTTTGNGHFYSSSGDTVFKGNENVINVKLPPEFTADVYSSRSLLNFCKKNIDSNIDDAVLLSDNAFKEFDSIGYRSEDIALQILLLPLLCLLPAEILDSCCKNIWRWKEKKMAESVENGTYVEYKFVLA